MRDLSEFPITRRWPAQHPTRLQLYSLPTPNGQKVAIMLEEIGLPYEAHRVDLGANEQLTPEFLSLNPNNKIPAIIDPDGPGGAPLGLFESGAILLYLARKSGRLLPGGAGEWKAIQWLMFQMGGVGPMFGQNGFFLKFGGKDIADPRPRQRYLDETRRLLGVLEGALAGRDWIADEYSIADIALVPWMNALDFYGAKPLVGWDELKNVPAWVERFMQRPAVQRGCKVPA
jgi:GST-like protein